MRLVNYFSRTIKSKISFPRIYKRIVRGALKFISENVEKYFTFRVMVFSARYINVTTGFNRLVGWLENPREGVPLLWANNIINQII